MAERAVPRRIAAGKLVNSRSHAKASAPPKPQLVDFEHLPKWSQEAPHIRKYYRQISNSTSECFHSLVYLHNETINIYSHLIPALCTVAFEVLFNRLFLSRYPKATLADRFVFSFHLLTIIICFGLSAGYHTFLCHSEEVAGLWARIDYCGIMTLIFGSFFSGIYVGMYCESALQALYWTMIAIFTTTTAFVVLNPTLQSPNHRTLRLCSFTATGFSAFGPIVHMLSIFPADRVARQSGLYYYLAEGAIFLLAAIIYGTQFPESQSPGRFDIFAASHQIFHVLVVVGAGVHVAGLKSAFEHNYFEERC